MKKYALIIGLLFSGLSAHADINCFDSREYVDGWQNSDGGSTSYLWAPLHSVISMSGQVPTHITAGFAHGYSNSVAHFSFPLVKISEGVYQTQQGSPVGQVREQLNDAWKGDAYDVITFDMNRNVLVFTGYMGNNPAIFNHFCK